MQAVLATAIALVLVAGVAACGEKDEPEPSAPTGGAAPATTTTATTKPDGGGGGGGQKVSPEEEIETTVAAVLGGGEPAAVCADLVTTRYVKVAYGDESGCRAATARQGGFNVAVSAVEITGKTASAKAKPAAGPNKGETIKVELTEEGGVWKVDSAVSNAPPGP